MTISVQELGSRKCYYPRTLDSKRASWAPATSAIAPANEQSATCTVFEMWAGARTRAVVLCFGAPGREYTGTLGNATLHAC